MPQLLIFILERQRYGLRLEAVQRVVRAAAVTPLPKAPDIVMGVISLQGAVIPVVNLRRRFGLPEAGLRTSDQFIVAGAGKRTVALAVDGTDGLLDLAQAFPVDADQIAPGTTFLEGVADCEDGMVLIHDLASLLFPDEEELLARALASAEE